MSATPIVYDARLCVMCIALLHSIENDGVRTIGFNCDFGLRYHETKWLTKFGYTICIWPLDT